MRRHQVLTGAVNPGNHCFSVGSIASFTFWAYGSGCDLVILGVDLQPIHIIPGHLREYQLITCLDCCQFCGKIAVSYGSEIVIYHPKLIQNEKDGVPVFTWLEEATLKLDENLGHVNVLSWASTGERLLVGCKEILLWERTKIFPKSFPRPTLKVQFSIEEIEEEDEYLQENTSNASHDEPSQDFKWELLWSSGIDECPCDVQFSPDDTLFASVARGDTMIKVWHQRSSLPVELFKNTTTTSGERDFKNPFLSPSRFAKKDDTPVQEYSEKLDFTFSYLIHPKPVAGFSWRKGVPLLPNGSVPNVLISSCHDSMCRIWCETLTPETDIAKLAAAHTTAIPKQMSGKKKPHPSEKNLAVPIPVKKSISAPAISNTSETMTDFRLPDKSSLRLFRHFHIAATINPTSDIPLLHSISSMDPYGDGETNCSDGAGPLVFTVHWLDNKHHHAMAHLNKLLHETMTETRTERLSSLDGHEDDGTSIHSHTSVYSNSTAHSARSSQASTPLKRPSDFASKFPVWDRTNPESVDAYLSCLASPMSPDIQSDLGLSLSGNIYGLLRRTWLEQSDALFAIHPTDGSLLVWHVSYLDENRCGQIRQPQVSFSSRIPLAIPARDASTLSPRLVLYANHYSAYLGVNDANPQESPSSQKMPDLPPSSEQMDRDFLASNGYQTPSINLLSKHSDGSLNQWEISFTANAGYSTISSLTHRSRFCGHRYHLSDIFRHPTLPLLLTTSHHRDPNKTNHAEHGSEVNSELILWRVDPVGALCHTGGVTELTRMNGHNMTDFCKVAWFPVLFPSWCLGAANTSPSSCFVSLHDSSLHIYQAVVDAEELLDGLEAPMLSSHPDSKTIGFIASRQSSSQPGCVLLLDVVEIGKDINLSQCEILLLSVFPENQFSESGEKSKDESLSNTARRGHVSENFFVVLVYESSNIFGKSKVMVKTWKISFTANVNSLVGARSRRGTAAVVMSDSSDEASDDNSITEDVSDLHIQRLSYLNVFITKMTPQTLNHPPGETVTLACAAQDPFSLSIFQQIQPLPFCFLTTSEKGKVYFWHAERNGEDKECLEWKIETDQNDDADFSPKIDVDEKPLIIKMAHCCLLACLSVSDTDYHLSVFDCLPSGGAVWQFQDKIDVARVSSCPPKRVHLDWLSREDGSFLVTVNVGRKVKIYAQSPIGMRWEDMDHRSKVLEKDTDVTPSIRPLLKRQSTRDVVTRQKMLRPFKSFDAGSKGQGSDHLLRWTLLSEIAIGNSVGISADRPPHPVMVSWVRDGLLLVATETAMHIYCHWMEQGSPSSEPSSVSSNGLLYGSASLSQSTPEGLCQYLLQEPSTQGGPQFSSGAPVVSLMSFAEVLSPCLPQYHPLVLSELTNGGHLDTVKHILVNLSVAINRQFEPSDDTIQEEPLKLKKFGLEMEDDDQQCKGCLSPLLLYDLLDEDGKINEKLSQSCASSDKPKPSTPAVKISGQQDTKKQQTDYDDLFATEEVEEEDALELFLDEKPNTGSNEIIDLSQFEPGYLGSEHCQVLHNYLSRNLLPGLTSLDQMELMAIADTVANAVHVERSSSVNAHSGVDAGGRGYAASGNTATESMDQCGLRFVFAMHNHICLLRSLPAPQRAKLLRQGLGSCHFAWAFHSDAEEEMLSLIASVQRGAPEWDELRSFGAGWWIRSTATLRRLIEQTARAAFQKENNPLDAAIFYMALNKKNVLKGLFKSVHEDRMMQFFSQDFKEERWHKAALKNAFALMGKQRFQEAAAFFLLANSVQDAVEVCIEKMEDLQLASIIVRLYDQEKSASAYSDFLQKYVLGDSEGRKILPDPFIRSMAYWQLGSYEDSLKTLLDNQRSKDEDSKDSQINITDVFNFYNFLRTHPLIVRQKKIDQSQAVSGPDQDVDDRITPEERMLFFATAASHLDAGCPLLTLDVLSSLPPLQEDKDEEQDEIDGPDLNDQASMLFDSPGIIKPSGQDSSSAADWGDSSFDTGIKDELELDWSESEEESDSERIEDRPRVQLTVPTPIKKEISEEKVAPQKPAVKKNTVLYSDVYAHQLRLMACLKIFVSELKLIATSQHSDSGQIREQLYSWLEKETEVLLRISPYNHEKLSSSKLIDGVSGADTDRSQRSEFSSGSESDGEKKVTFLGRQGESPAGGSFHPVPSLHELYLAEKQDWKMRRETASHRRRWLKQYRRFLRSLLSYCSLHDDAQGTLSPLRIELLLLLQDSLQEKTPQQLSSPLPNPTSVPLLTSSVVACRTVVAEPMERLTHMARDILATVLEISDPPPYAVKEGVQPATVVLCWQAGALADCIYQSLCDMNSKTYRARLLDKPSSSDYLQPRASISSHQASERRYVPPSSLPSQWPGVVSLQALLNSESSDNRPRLIVLLCESLVAVYVSLLAHGLQTCNSSLLYRLVNNSLCEKSWNAVFGGGARVAVKYTRPATAGSPSRGMDGDKVRERLNRKALYYSHEKQGSNTSLKSADSMSYREKFVAPETTLWDFFLTKPLIHTNGAEELDFESDSDGEGDTNSIDIVFSDDEDNELGEPKSENKATEHGDPNSYSWHIMRLAIVRSILHNLKTFLPTTGLEISELGISSPMLNSVIQLLGHWQVVLAKELEAFVEPPPDYIVGIQTLSASLRGRPAILKHQAMLDPNNTPFTAASSEAQGAKRLWHCLVRKENLQELFIRYIFRKKNMHEKSGRPNLERRETEFDISTSGNGVPKKKNAPAKKKLDKRRATIAVMSPDSNSGSGQFFQGENGMGFADGRMGKVKILHKETEIISSFCINNANPNCVVLATSRDVQEIDVSALLACDSWSWIEEDMSPSNLEEMQKPSAQKEEEFLVVSRKQSMFVTPTPSMHLNAASPSLPSAVQTGQGASVLLKRSFSGVRRMTSHPTLPYYLTGHHDGCIRMWEWGHQQQISLFRQTGQFPKVTGVHFSALGNKISAVDADGYLALWQVSTPRIPFLYHQCHDRAAADSCFMSSTSVIATAGLSSSNRNVAIWDTLLPPKSMMVKEFAVHEGVGATCLSYAAQTRTLVIGGKDGRVSVFDLRRPDNPLQCFNAHEAPIKCIALSPDEKLFVTGSVAGDVRVWDVNSHLLVYNLSGEHARTSLFRNFGSGTMKVQFAAPGNRVFSCGADGTLKLRILPHDEKEDFGLGNSIGSRIQKITLQKQVVRLANAVRQQCLAY